MGEETIEAYSALAASALIGLGVSFRIHVWSICGYKLSKSLSSLTNIHGSLLVAL